MLSGFILALMFFGNIYQEKQSDDNVHIINNEISQNSIKAVSNTPVIENKNIASEDIINLDKFSKIIEGVWDNELQTFFEPQNKIPNDKRHIRINVSIKEIAKIKNDTKEGKTFWLEYSNGNNTLLSRVWQANLSNDKSQIIITPYDIKKGINLSSIAKKDPKLSSLNMDNLAKLNGCEIYFSQNGDSYKGQTLENKCQTIFKDGKLINNFETHIFSDTKWEVSDIGKDANGKKIYGNMDYGPTILKKAQSFTCWASIFDNNKSKYATNLKINDQGGEVIANLNDKSLKLKLRNIEWADKKIPPALTLYLITNPKTDYADVYAWTDKNANSISISYAQYQASCTRD